MISKFPNVLTIITLLIPSDSYSSYMESEETFRRWSTRPWQNSCSKKNQKKTKQTYVLTKTDPDSSLSTDSINLV